MSAMAALAWGEHDAAEFTGGTGSRANRRPRTHAVDEDSIAMETPPRGAPTPRSSLLKPSTAPVLPARGLQDAIGLTPAAT